MIARMALLLALATASTQAEPVDRAKAAALTACFAKMINEGTVLPIPRDRTLFTCMAHKRLEFCLECRLGEGEGNGCADFDDAEFQLPCYKWINR